MTGILEQKSETILNLYVKGGERTVEKARQEKDNKIIVKEVLAEFQKYRKASFINPLMRTVSAMPKEEMAFIAKAIVDLTAVRRKFASSMETVGGAVDVAIISKGDGFIWIDRKHYFDLKLNSDFMDRKVASRGDGYASIQPAKDARGRTKRNRSTPRAEHHGVKPRS